MCLFNDITVWASPRLPHQQISLRYWTIPIIIQTRYYFQPLKISLLNPLLTPANSPFNCHLYDKWPLRSSLYPLSPISLLPSSCESAQPGFCSSTITTSNNLQTAKHSGQISLFISFDQPAKFDTSHFHHMASRTLQTPGHHWPLILSLPSPRPLYVVVPQASVLGSFIFSHPFPWDLI